MHLFIDGHNTISVDVGSGEHSAACVAKVKSIRA